MSKMCFFTTGPARVLPVFLTASLLAAALAAAGPAANAPDETQGIAQRVVSLSPIVTETLYLVGAQDRLIANTSYCVVPEAARFKEKIGSVKQMNLEKIIRLAPDLVIGSTFSREKQLQMLERQGIEVLRVPNPKTFEDMCTLTLTIGRRTGRAARAREIVEKAGKEADAIRSLTKDLPKPTVFMQIGLKPLHSVNKDMFINDYIRYAGGLNIAENEASGIYSREKVVARDPDIILIATMGTSKKAAEAEKQRWLAFKSMKAVQAGRVHALDPDMICSPTPVTFVQSIRDLLPLIHPQLDPADILSASGSGTGSGPPTEAGQ